MTLGHGNSSVGGLGTGTGADLAANAAAAAAGTDNNLQLYFKSALDTLVSFMLQTWPHIPPAAQAALHQLPPAAAPGAQAQQQPQAPAGLGTASSSRLAQDRGSPASSRPASPFGTAGGGGGGGGLRPECAAPAAGQYEEVHAVVEGACVWGGVGWP